MSAPIDAVPPDEPVPGGGPGPEAAGPAEAGPAADTFDEVREAAGAVVASLKWLIDATERVIEDPAAFSQVVESGRSVVEAFTGGFLHDTDAGETSTGSGEAGPGPDS